MKEIGEYFGVSVKAVGHAMATYMEPKTTTSVRHKEKEEGNAA